MIDLKEIKHRYKIKDFIEQQEEVLENLLDEEKQDNILYMAPAARGKTLPPLIATLENMQKRPKKMTLWFMPTIALAHDFIKRIEEDGNYRKLISALEQINYVCFTGEDVIDKVNKKIQIAKSGDPDILIISPESLEDPAFMAWLLGSERNIGQIVLDEAHLFDEWGITFRRSYFIISWLICTLREQNHSFKVIALSASLPEGKRKVVMKMLHFTDTNTFLSRPLALHIGPKIVCHSTNSKNEKEKLLIKILEYNLNQNKNVNKKTKGIIFSPYKSEKTRQGIKLEWSVKNIENDIVPLLNLKEYEYALYTGDTAIDKRADILNDLHHKNGKIRLLLTTSAFGFGIDIDKLDFSIHVEVPEDIDRFYQEISRCSRTPMHGSADIFYSSHEVAAQTKRIMGTLKYETTKEYLEYLGIKNIRKGNKTLSLNNALKKGNKQNKEYNNLKRAQMGADAYIDNALEAIIFFYRHNIIELRPLQNNNFPEKMSKLREAFESGKRSGYREVIYKGFNVVIPSVKLPIKILKNAYWPEIERLVAEDKIKRGKRTEIFRKMGKNQTCHWKLIADHYNVELQDNNGKILEKCTYCNVCIGRRK